MDPLLHCLPGKAGAGPALGAFEIFGHLGASRQSRAWKRVGPSSRNSLDHLRDRIDLNGICLAYWLFLASLAFSRGCMDTTVYPRSFLSPSGSRSSITSL